MNELRPYWGKIMAIWTYCLQLKKLPLDVDAALWLETA
jgi:hypothetical protein